MSRLIFISILSFLLLGSTRAQSIYEYRDTVKWLFSYTPNQRSVNNKVLNQLALAHLKIPEKTSFIYNFEYLLSVDFQRNDTLIINLDINPTGVNGDKKIRSFDIQQILKPSIYDLDLTLEDPVKGIILTQSMSIVMNGINAPVYSFPDSLWKEGMMVRVEFNNISFSNNDYRVIELELSAIRDYFAASALGDSLEKKIQRSRINTKSIEEAMNVYSTGIKGINLLEQSLKAKSMIVPGSDPLKLAHLTRILRFKFYEYIDFLNKNDKALFTGNVYQRTARAYIQSLKDANVMSQRVDYYSSPFFYKLYTNSITASQLLESRNRFINETKSRGLKNINIRKLTELITREYLKESNRLLNLDRYVEAVDLLTGAKKFSDLNPYDLYSSEIESQLQVARNGLVYSYTGIIQRALDKNLLTLAEKYLAEVEIYTQKYGLPSSEKFREVYLRLADIHSQLGSNYLVIDDYGNAYYEYSRALELVSVYESGIKTRLQEGLLISVRGIYNQYINQIDGLIEVGDYKSATNKLKVAQDFADDFSFFYPDVSIVDSIKYQLALLKYDDLISQITTSINGKEITSSIDKLIEVVGLSQEFKLRQVESLDTLVNDIGMPYINSLFAIGRSKHWTNQPDSALYFAGKAMNLAEKLEINNTGNINEQYNALYKLASETYCADARGVYISLVAQAEYSFKNNRFREALERIDKAREHVYAKATCGLSTTVLNNLLANYHNQIVWDNMVASAFKLLSEGKFESSAILIQQAESIFSFYSLDTTGLANVGYFELAMNSPNIPLIKHAIGYHVMRDKLEQSLTLLEKLRHEGVIAGETNDLQESLARKLALRDNAETMDLDLNLMLETYTGGDKWYQRFDKAYRFHVKLPANSLKGSFQRIKVKLGKRV